MQFQTLAGLCRRRKFAEARVKGWTKRVALSAAAALVAFLLAALPASGEATLSFIDPNALSDANDGSLKESLRRTRRAKMGATRRLHRRHVR